MIGFRLHLYLGALVVGLALLPVSLQAAIVDSGNVEPDVSQWNSLTTAYIGRASDGSVRIDAASALTSNNSFLGYQAGATGQATVAGAGTQWTNGNSLYVGGSGVGDLLIEAGAHVSNATGYLGNSFYSEGTATVTGAGSQWTSSSSFYVGNFGSGILTIEAGGQVNNATGYLGYWSNSSGSVSVTGTGSAWTNSGGLYVGDQGSADLSITGGGLVKVGGTLTIDSNSDGDGAINMATGGMLALAGDADDSLSQFLSLVNGTDAIRYWDASLSNWAPITSATSGDDFTLSYSTTGDLAGYTLLEVGRVGDFDNDGDVDGRDFLVWQRHPYLGRVGDWQANYGVDAVAATEISVKGASPVPEPGGLVLLVGFVLLRSRRGSGAGTARSLFRPTV